MIKVMVVADDNTGALDTGVQFAEQGGRTLVLHGLKDLEQYLDEEWDVLVVNTETRHKEAKTAFQTVYQASRKAFQKGVPYLYKKVDSGLRGNIGAELEAALKAYEAEGLVFAPAFPEMKRVVRAGILYIDGKPVHEGIFSRDPFEPVQCSGISAIIGQETKIPVCLMKKGDDPEKREKGGAWIYAYDSETQEDLQEIVQGFFREKELSVIAGCAGLARAFSKTLFSGRKGAFECCEVNQTVVVCGSLNPKTQEQIAYAAKEGLHVRRLCTEDLLPKTFFSADRWKEALTEIREAAQKGESCILATELQREKGQISETDRENIAKRLGEIGNVILKENGVQSLFIIGGDTLSGFLHASEIPGIVPLGEKDTGVVFSRIEVQGEKKYLITKSGGLGTKKAIYEAITDRRTQGEEV